MSSVSLMVPFSKHRLTLHPVCVYTHLVGVLPYLSKYYSHSNITHFCNFFGAPFYFVQKEQLTNLSITHPLGFIHSFVHSFIPFTPGMRCEPWLGSGRGMEADPHLPRTKLGEGHSGFQGRVQKAETTHQASRMFLMLTEGGELRFSTWMAFPQNPSGS